MILRDDLLDVAFLMEQGTDGNARATSLYQAITADPENESGWFSVITAAMQWNDAAGRTQAQVVSLLRRAAYEVPS